jgi:endonuclease/exonuclease/phosphatase family metal-dependent hydrolase
VAPLPRERVELRVLVYNIHAGKDAAGADNLERVAAMIRETRADVVLLQEVDRGTERSDRTDQPAVLARLTGYHAAFGKTLDYQGGEYGIAVLSRWPITRDTLVRLPVRPPQQRAGGSYEPRGLLHATVAGPAGAIHVLNTHLDPSAEDGYRIQEVTAVLAYAERIAAGADLVILGGDFNALPESRVHRQVIERTWRDAWDACGRGSGGGGGGGGGATYPDAAPLKRIDYLFFPAGLGCDSAVVLDSRASDHRPLLVIVPGDG